jgi:hypothetical protein
MSGNSGMGMEASSIAIHEDPLWRAKGNFVINADLAAHGMPGRWEQLWARKVSEDRFELCCIPFFTYGMRLGDIVRTAPASGKQFMVQEVVQAGGRINVRLAVSVGDERDSLTPKLLSDITKVGCGAEVFKPGYIAIDIPTEEQEQQLLTLLDPLVASDRITLERI